MQAGDPAVFAVACSRAADDATVWLVWAGGYRTLGSKCEAVVNELARVRLPEEVVTERETYEHGSLFPLRVPRPLRNPPAHRAGAAHGAPPLAPLLAGGHRARGCVSAVGGGPGAGGGGLRGGDRRGRRADAPGTARTTSNRGCSPGTAPSTGTSPTAATAGSRRRRCASSPSSPSWPGSVAVPLFGARSWPWCWCRTSAALVAGVLLCAWPGGRPATTGSPSGRLADRPAAPGPGARARLRRVGASGPRHRRLPRPAAGPVVDGGRPRRGRRAVPPGGRGARLSRPPWRRPGGSGGVLAGGLARAAAVLGPGGGPGRRTSPGSGAESATGASPMRLQETEELRGWLRQPADPGVGLLAGLFGDERFGDGLHAPWILLYVALLVVVFLWHWPLVLRRLRRRHTGGGPRGRGHRLLRALRPVRAAPSSSAPPG